MIRGPEGIACLLAPRFAEALHERVVPELRLMRGELAGEGELRHARGEIARLGIIGGG